MSPPMRRALASLMTVGASLLLASGPVRADIPPGYAGKPFDPAIAGGAGKIPPSVKAGPYSIPGRIDFVNYDLGGSGVAYNSGLHETSHAGNGYRTDTPAPTLCLTSQGDKDKWYDTSSALDGTFYPTPTTQDFYIGAVQNGDWFNFTVNVLTAGTYSLSSTWATGNGPPGGEGGDGTMGLQVFVNGTMAATWSAGFPNYQTEASYHNWRAYPGFATITLAAGIQVIKLQSMTKHLNLDYVDFELATSDGGLDTNDASSSGSAGGSGAAGSGTTVANSGSTAPSGSLGASGNMASSGSLATSGTVAPSGSPSSLSGDSAPSSGSSGSASGASSAPIATGGAPGGATTGSGSGAGVAKSGSGCAVAPSGHGAFGGFGLALAGVLVARSRRRAPHRR
jgi:MYXO-CTERM domain-containing protein